MKRFLSILLALVMVLSLVACGNKTTPDTPDTPDKQEETHPHRYRDRFRLPV